MMIFNKHFFFFFKFFVALSVALMVAIIIICLLHFSNTGRGHMPCTCYINLLNKKLL